MKPIIALILLSLLFIACGDGSSDVSEEDIVRKSFGYYKTAILAGSGAEALQWVDRTTLSYYDRILTMAKQADSTTVRALDLQDRYMVMLVRHSIPIEDVLRMDAGGLFKHAIEGGMFGESGLDSMDIGNVTVEGNVAMGDLVVKGKPSGLSFRFNKEGGLWKIDLTSLFPAARTEFRKLVTQSGKSEDSIIVALLEYQNGKKPGPEVWEPVGSAVVR